MMIDNPEPLKRVLKDIFNLRESLLDLEDTYPYLFAGRDPIISRGWEYWCTDEILERIHDQISDVLEQARNKTEASIQ